MPQKKKFTIFCKLPEVNLEENCDERIFPGSTNKVDTYSARQRMAKNEVMVRRNPVMYYKVVTL